MQINQKPSMYAQVILRRRFIENNGLPLFQILKNAEERRVRIWSYFFQGADFAFGKGLIPSKVSQA